MIDPGRAPYRAFPYFLRSAILEPVFISWATMDAFYLSCADRLGRSLNAFGLESHIVFKENPGDWAACCHFKAKFIIEMLDTFPGRDPVWIDVDGEILAPPDFLNTIQTDLAFVENAHGEPIASMIFLRNNLRVRAFVERWIEENRLHPDNPCADQENFGAVVRKMEYAGKLSVTRLPPSYNFERGITAPISEPIVIYQHIASRLGVVPGFEAAHKMLTRYMGFEPEFEGIA